MAIKYIKTSSHTPGKVIKFSGSGGELKARSVPGGGGPGGTLTLTKPGPFGDQVLTITEGSAAGYISATSATLASTYASKAYTISTSDSLYNAVTQIASGNMSVNLNTVSFGDYFGSTYFVTVGPLTKYVFIAVASGVTFRIEVTPPPPGM